MKEYTNENKALIIYDNLIKKHSSNSYCYELKVNILNIFLVDILNKLNKYDEPLII